MMCAKKDMSANAWMTRRKARVTLENINDGDDLDSKLPILTILIMTVAQRRYNNKS
jgi:hypothetical protein